MSVGTATVGKLFFVSVGKVNICNIFVCLWEQLNFGNCSSCLWEHLTFVAYSYVCGNSSFKGTFSVLSVRTLYICNLSVHLSEPLSVCLWEQLNFWKFSLSLWERLIFVAYLRVCGNTDFDKLVFLLSVGTRNFSKLVFLSVGTLNFSKLVSPSVGTFFKVAFLFALYL